MVAMVLGIKDRDRVRYWISMEISIANTMVRVIAEKGGLT